MEQNELEKLLSLAAERLGTTPEQLKAEASSGELSSLLTQLSPTDAQNLQRVLSDRDAAQKLLSSPEAQELLRYLHQP